ncbi:MAG TPA: hypothetical protein VGO47_06490 [Chlamydiales bacterium]|jgi:hypothetical protein|nr:hypothetical protein [Chlamydiales bacterium]
MRLLARGLQHLSRRIPANANFITRIHTSSFRYKDQPSSKSSTNVPADSSKDSSSLESDENLFRQYFYRLPDPVLDDVQVEIIWTELQI